jgi:hypothetical protein
MTKIALLALLLAVPAARADEPTPAKTDTAAPPAAAKVDTAAPPAAAKVDTAAPSSAAKADTAAPPAAGAATDRPYVDAAIAFFKGLAHSNRSGEAGDQGWAEAKANAGDKVQLKLPGKELEIDLVGKKSDARVMRFQKVSTLRDGAKVKGVALENLELKIGEDSHAGKAVVLMDEKDGKWLVTSIEVQ